MKITKVEVEHVAHLARLDFGEEEKETFTSQLNDILMYI
ncbi:MAG: Asp-tRNA(Asn)/Glu-tRNA(Gln) amidotransferase subunit GatC, partial [Deltaproteobacteria bacterium]